MEYLESKVGPDLPRDFILRVMDAVGFDELCSIRGLHDLVGFKLSGRRWSSNGPRVRQETIVRSYLTTIVTREKPLVMCMIPSSKLMLIYCRIMTWLGELGCFVTLSRWLDNPSM